MSPNPFNLIRTSLTCSLPSRFLVHEFLRPLDSFVINGATANLSVVKNLFDVSKAEVIDVL